MLVPVVIVTLGCPGVRGHERDRLVQLRPRAVDVEDVDDVVLVPSACDEVAADFEQCASRCARGVHFVVEEDVANHLADGACILAVTERPVANIATSRVEQVTIAARVLVQPRASSTFECFVAIVHPSD
jgi:hypothetical protein